MKFIDLPNGLKCIVDDCDFELYSIHKWHINGRYVSRSMGISFKTRKIIRMHRLIMDAPENMEVDHINGDKLDNRRENLRLCTRTENMQNKRGKAGCSSKYKSVMIRKTKWAIKWVAVIRINRVKKYIGSFKSEIEAAKAYNEAALKYFGNFARLNLID